MKRSQVVSLDPQLAHEPDRIRVFLHDCRINLHVGYRAHEKEKPQAVIIHVDVEAGLPHRYQDLAENSLDRVLDYSRLFHFVTEQLPQFGHIALLETVAETILSFCFEDCRVDRVRVQVEKPDIYQGRARAGVDLTRTRPRGKKS